MDDRRRRACAVGGLGRVERSGRVVSAHSIVVRPGWAAHRPGRRPRWPDDRGPWTLLRRRTDGHIRKRQQIHEVTRRGRRPTSGTVRREWLPIPKPIPSCTEHTSWIRRVRGHVPPGRFKRSPSARHTRRSVTGSGPSPARVLGHVVALVRAVLSSWAWSVDDFRCAWRRWTPWGPGLVRSALHSRAARWEAEIGRSGELSASPASRRPSR